MRPHVPSAEQSPLRGSGDGLALRARQVDEAIVASLIVSTRNRAGFLTPFLDSLEGLAVHHPFEIILVDNDSTDDTWALLQDFAERCRFQVQVLREPRAGASHGRNAGITAARGRILCFTDDDCYAHPEMIDALVEIFRTQEVGFIGGQTLLFDPEDDPVCVTNRTDPIIFPAGSFITTGEIQGSCMAFRREVLDSVGLFDPAFGAGAPLKGAEDCDLVARASFGGWAGGFFPEPVTRHHHRRRGDGAKMITWSYDFARGAHLAKLIVEYPQHRCMILKHWYWNTQVFWRPSSHAFQKFWRELCGAGRYLLGHALRASAPAI
ncbi:MAG TPA: glycosyltransferase family A protein [Caulobacteraceae bacterium]|jgi:glycosyltransferase involved in cell wall biosynthesis|nr:glycosyltransferase family A protein [Caulobacteraceae bacterium]